MPIANNIDTKNLSIDKFITWTELDGWMFRHGDGTLLGPFDDKKELIAYVVLYTSAAKQRDANSER